MTPELVNILVAVFGFLGAIVVAWFTTQAKFRAEVELNKQKIEELEKRLQEVSRSSSEELRKAREEVSSLKGKIERYEEQIERAMQLLHQGASSLGHAFGDRLSDLITHHGAVRPRRNSLGHSEDASTENRD